MKEDCRGKKDDKFRTSSMDQIQKIGQRISFYRHQRNMTQKELAEKASISLSYISKIESSGTDITFSLLSLYQIAEALGLQPYQLLMPASEEFLAPKKDSQQ